MKQKHLVRPVYPKNYNLFTIDHRDISHRTSRPRVDSVELVHKANWTMHLWVRMIQLQQCITHWFNMLQIKQYFNIISTVLIIYIMSDLALFSFSVRLRHATILNVYFISNSPKYTLLYYSSWNVKWTLVLLLEYKLFVKSLRNWNLSDELESELLSLSSYWWRIINIIINNTNASVVKH